PAARCYRTPATEAPCRACAWRRTLSERWRGRPRAPNPARGQDGAPRRARRRAAMPHEITFACRQYESAHAPDARRALPWRRHDRWKARTADPHRRAAHHRREQVVRLAPRGENLRRSTVAERVADRPQQRRAHVLVVAILDAVRHVP